MYNQVEKELLNLQNKEKIEIFKRFFKTKKGEYGYGDIFIGLTIPQIRNIAKKYSKEISFDDVKRLIESDIHEFRMTGYLILTYKMDVEDEEKIYNFYINNLEGCNNWDLVDLSSYKIVGKYLKDKDRDILYEFVKSENMWIQRISIVSCMSFVKDGDIKDALKISKLLLNHSHDLIHKAVGWILREVGKKDMNELEKFLNTNYKDIPRTTLRYAIERMDEEKRLGYLQAKSKGI